MQHFAFEIESWLSEYGISCTIELGNNAKIETDSGLILWACSVTKGSTLFSPKDDGLVIWEDLWRNRNAQVKSRLISAIGKAATVYGRETVVEKIDKPTAKAFLASNHLVGPANSHFILGLYQESDLIAVAAFGKPCPIDREGGKWISVELIRFCSKLNTTVVGGLSKLIKRYIELKSPEDLMTSIDLEWTPGRGFEKLGFKDGGLSNSQSFWIAPNTLERFPENAIENDADSLLREGWTKLTNRGNRKLILPLK